MSGPVDVLAVLDAEISAAIAIGGSMGPSTLTALAAGISQMQEARAAVAELIEAASDLVDTGYGSPRRIERLESALARVRGAA